MKIVRTVMTSVLATGFLLCFISAASAQGTNLGTIRGTVTDPNGAVIPNASVQITDKATGLSRDLTTNGDGNYEAAALKPGRYEVAVTATGFKKTVVEAVLSGSETIRADIKAEVGTQSETVLVNGADAGIIQRDQPVIAGGKARMATARSSLSARRVTARPSRWTASASMEASSVNRRRASLHSKLSAS